MSEKRRTKRIPTALHTAALFSKPRRYVSCLYIYRLYNLIYRIWKLI